MQTKWGEATLEEHAFDFIRSSALMQPLQKSAAGGVHMVQTSIKWLSKQVNQKISGQNGDNKAALGGRASEFKLQRSNAVEQNKNSTAEE